MPNHLADLIAAQERHDARVADARRRAEIQAWVSWPEGGIFRRNGPRGESAHAVHVYKPFTVDEWREAQHAEARRRHLAAVVDIAHQIVDQDAAMADALPPTGQTTAPDSTATTRSGVESGATNSQAGA